MINNYDNLIIFFSLCSPLSLPAPVGKCFYQLLVIQTFRPDRLLAMGNNFVATVMGKNFMSAAEQELDLARIVNDEVCPIVN